MLEITLTWVPGYRPFYREKTTHHSFARSRTLRIKLTYGLSLSTVFFDLAISAPLWIIA